MSKNRIYWPIHVLVFIAGLVISFTMLSGDDLGRVNLLYLLLLYFLLPVLGGLLSLYSLIFDAKVHMAQWLARFGLLKLTQLQFFLNLRKANVDRLWLLQQSQIMAVSFAISSMLVLFVLLLFSDIAFVWRSTLLTPEHVYNILTVIASPWFFWQEAQPDLQLLQVTQDFRLADSSVDYLQTGQWWLFILMTQLFYSILLRGIIYMALQFKINKALTKQQQNIDPNPAVVETTNTLVTLVPALLSETSDYDEIIIWDQIPNSILHSVFENEILNTTEQASMKYWQGTQAELAKLSDAEKPLLVLKGWEPPMGELADALALNSGYILAINWHGESLKALTEVQLLEWSRFCQEYDWQLLLTEAVSNDH
ncbi:MAG: DUF2868 domain-containing protein [Gammaproteobacteria bacterium]|nr:DUF2868 domain-containing protein [Gammaproteobacteria bacterium]NNJ72918.1 DUF2868 domain-containing protein [Enterobacterales bacterium]